VYVNFTTDEKGRPQIFGEAGGYIGYRIGGVLRHGENRDRTEQINDVKKVRNQQVRTKISNIADMENIQYGLYVRAGYRNIAVFAQYRLTDLFTEFKTNVLGNNTAAKNPLFPPLEFGLTLLL